MPTEIRVRNFTSQVGVAQSAAVAALQAIDPDVLIVLVPTYNPAVELGKVISQVNDAVAISEAGGPAGSHGTRITLTISVPALSRWASSLNEAAVA